MFQINTSKANVYIQQIYFFNKYTFFHQNKIYTTDIIFMTFKILDNCEKKAKLEYGKTSITEYSLQVTYNKFNQLKICYPYKYIDL